MSYMYVFKCIFVIYCQWDLTSHEKKKETKETDMQVDLINKPAENWLNVPLILKCCLHRVTKIAVINWEARGACICPKTSHLNFDRTRHPYRENKVHSYITLITHLSTNCKECKTITKNNSQFIYSPAWLLSSSVRYKWFQSNLWFSTGISIIMLMRKATIHIIKDCLFEIQRIVSDWILLIS
jgi:hypothetical protein